MNPQTNLGKPTPPTDLDISHSTLECGYFPIVFFTRYTPRTNDDDQPERHLMAITLALPDGYDPSSSSPIQTSTVSPFDDNGTSQQFYAWHNPFIYHPLIETETLAYSTNEPPVVMAPLDLTLSLHSLHLYASYQDDTSIALCFPQLEFTRISAPVDVTLSFSTIDYNKSTYPTITQTLSAKFTIPNKICIVIEIKQAVAYTALSASNIIKIHGIKFVVSKRNDPMNYAHGYIYRYYRPLPHNNHRVDQQYPLSHAIHHRSIQFPQLFSIEASVKLIPRELTPVASRTAHTTPFRLEIELLSIISSHLVTIHFPYSIHTTTATCYNQDGFSLALFEAKKASPPSSPIMIGTISTSGNCHLYIDVKNRQHPTSFQGEIELQRSGILPLSLPLEFPDISNLPTGFELELVHPPQNPTTTRSSLYHSRIHVYNTPITSTNTIQMVFFSPLDHLTEMITILPNRTKTTITVENMDEAEVQITYFYLPTSRHLDYTQDIMNYYLQHEGEEKQQQQQQQRQDHGDSYDVNHDPLYGDNVNLSDHQQTIEADNHQKQADDFDNNPHESYHHSILRQLMMAKKSQDLSQGQQQQQQQQQQRGGREGKMGTSTPTPTTQQHHSVMPPNKHQENTINRPLVIIHMQFLTDIPDDSQNLTFRVPIPYMNAVPGHETVAFGYFYRQTTDENHDESLTESLNIPARSFLTPTNIMLQATTAAVIPGESIEATIDRLLLDTDNSPDNNSGNTIYETRAAIFHVMELSSPESIYTENMIISNLQSLLLPQLYGCTGILSRVTESQPERKHYRHFSLDPSSIQYGQSTQYHLHLHIPSLIEEDIHPPDLDDDKNNFHLTVVTVCLFELPQISNNIEFNASLDSTTLSYHIASGVVHPLVMGYFIHSIPAVSPVYSLIAKIRFYIYDPVESIQQRGGFSNPPQTSVLHAICDMLQMTLAQTGKSHLFSYDSITIESYEEIDRGRTLLSSSLPSSTVPWSGRPQPVVAATGISTKATVSATSHQERIENSSMNDQSPFKTAQDNDKVLYQVFQGSIRIKAYGIYDLSIVYQTLRKMFYVTYPDNSITTLFNVSDDTSDFYLVMDEQYCMEGRRCGATCDNRCPPETPCKSDFDCSSFICLIDTQVCK